MHITCISGRALVGLTVKIHFQIVILAGDGITGKSYVPLKVTQFPVSPVVIISRGDPGGDGVSYSAVRLAYQDIGVETNIAIGSAEKSRYLNKRGSGN